MQNIMKIYGIPALLFFCALLLGFQAYQLSEIGKSIDYTNRQIYDLADQVKSQAIYLDDIKYGVLGVKAAVNNAQ